MLAALGGGGGLAASLKGAATAVVKCRKDLRVQAMLHEWWEVSKAHQHSLGKVFSALDGDTYFDVFVKVYKAMVSEYIEAEAVEAVQADWDADNGGTDELTEQGEIAAHHAHTRKCNTEEQIARHSDSHETP